MSLDPDKPPVVWALIDDRAGNRSQCLGVADALGLDYRAKEIGYGPLAKLPNALLGASFAGLDSASRTVFSPPWPDLVVAAGRRSASVARKIRRLGVGNVFLAQVMHPGAGNGTAARRKRGLLWFRIFHHLLWYGSPPTQGEPIKFGFMRSILDVRFGETNSTGERKNISSSGSPMGKEIQPTVIFCMPRNLPSRTRKPATA